MKKFLVVLGVLTGLAFVGVIVLIFCLGGIVKKGINTVGPRLTGTKVELASAAISPIGGAGTLSGLFVGNPPGWKSDKAFYLGKVHIDVVPLSLLGDHVVIEEITIDQPEFVYETKIVSSNIKDLLNNIEENTGAGQPPVAQTEEGKPMKFEVKKFVFTNGTVTLGVGAAAITLPLPPLTLTDLGTKEGGITAGQLAVKVMTHVLSDIVQATAAAAGKMTKAAGAVTTDAIGGAAKKAGEGLKNLFSGKKE